jgi:hypothetical protein
MKNPFGGFGKHSGGVTPKTQASHGKALGISQAIVPPHKKGPPAAHAPKLPPEPSVQPSLVPKFPKGLP